MTYHPITKTPTCRPWKMITKAHRRRTRGNEDITLLGLDIFAGVGHESGQQMVLNKVLKLPHFTHGRLLALTRDLSANRARSWATALKKRKYGQLKG
jgi:hypothetical protein